MRYSNFGKTGMKLSTLGFGCMRLPMKSGSVDRELSTPMLRRAVELGMNFFDSAIGYCSSDSQAAVGDAFKGMREKVFISTKNHHSTAKADEWWQHLEDSLRFLKTDYIDLYNHHGINWDLFVHHLDPEKGGRTKEMMKAKEQGLIKHIGISYHDTPENLIKIVDTGIYESVILQYNLLDQSHADAIQYAHEKGMGVVAMGPVGGGRLGLPSEKISELTHGQSVLSTALRFVWAHPGVDVALSGMETLAMLEENAKLASTVQPLSKEEINGLNMVVEERKKKSGLYCTACRYCIPACAQGVRIPENLDLLNQVLIYGLEQAAKERYGWLDGKAVLCIDCGKCEPLCPQSIKIPDKLTQAALLLDPAAESVTVNATIDEFSNDGSFTMPVKLFNFSPKNRDVKILFSPSAGMSLVNKEINLPGFKSMGRKTVTLSGGIPLAEGRYRATAEVVFDGIAHQVDAVGDLMIIKKAQATWTGGVWYESNPTADDFSAAKESIGQHGLKFKLVHDEKALILLADVKDDFLAPSSEDRHKGALVDGLEIYLDGRGEKIGGSAYDKGVYQVLVYPGTPGKAGPFFWCGQGLEGIKVESKFMQHGYKLKVLIPFSSFYLDKGKPAKIGFDIAVNTANESGARIAQYVFAGNKHNWHDASHFLRTLLI